ncbi:MAG: tetratricopeptide repeat protein [Desulfobacterales bacterium]|nr:tetratricopeptide repeat protein [Desulfobacterales bacterium]
MRKISIVFPFIILILICNTALSSTASMYKIKAEKHFSIGKYIQAGETYIIAAKQEVLSEKPRKNFILQCYKEASYCFYTVKDYLKALELMEEVLAWSIRDQKKSDTAEGVFNKGQILIKLSRYRDAIKCYEKALAINKELSKESGIARVMSKLGEALIIMEQYVRAEEYLDISLEIFIRKKENFNIGETVGVFGDLHHAKGDFVKAAKFYKRCLKYYMSIRDSSNIGLYYDKLGTNSFKARNYEAAYKYFARSTITYKNIGDDLNSTLEFFKIANTDITTGRLKQASKIIDPIVKKVGKKDIKRVNPKKKPETKIDPVILYHAFIGKADIEKMKKSYSKALLYYLKALDTNLPDLRNDQKVTLLIKIAETFALSGNYENALSLYEEARSKLAVYDGVLRKTYLLEKMGNLAYSYKLYDTAINYFEEAKRLNIEDPLLKSLNLAKIGEIYFYKKDEYLAKKFLLDSIKIQEELLENEPLKRKHILGKSYSKSNKYLYIISYKKDKNRGLDYLQRAGLLPHDNIDEIKKKASRSAILYYNSIKGAEDIFGIKPSANFLMVIKKAGIKMFRLNTFDIDPKVLTQYEKIYKNSDSNAQKKGVDYKNNHSLHIDNLSFLISLFKKFKKLKNKDGKIISELISKTLYSILIEPVETEIYQVKRLSVVPSNDFSNISFKALLKHSKLNNKIRVHYISLRSKKGFNKE